MPTPKRDVRMEDALWLPAMEKAGRLGTNLSVVLRHLLREWLDEPEG